MVGEELDEAELVICRQLQRERYPKAFRTLQLGLQIHPTDKIPSLHPVWDDSSESPEEWSSRSSIKTPSHRSSSQLQLIILS